eukprot:scaffold261857_cov31-Tisochrysis_lutea.AAC.1
MGVHRWCSEWRCMKTVPIAQFPAGHNGMAGSGLKAEPMRQSLLRQHTVKSTSTLPYGERAPRWSRIGSGVPAHL